MRTQKSVIGKKGDWIQMFMILFFFLLLCVALALFFLEKDALETVRPELTGDLNHHKTTVVLHSVLRMPYEKDVDGDGVKETITFAQAISLGMEEEDLQTFLASALPQDVPYLMRVEYGNRAIEANRLDALGSNAAIVKNTAPRPSLQLPLATVSFIYADEQVLKELKGIIKVYEQSRQIRG